VPNHFPSAGPHACNDGQATRHCLDDRQTIGIFEGRTDVNVCGRVVEHDVIPWAFELDPVSKPETLNLGTEKITIVGSCNNQLDWQISVYR